MMSSENESLSGIIAAYLEAVDAGENPDRKELLSRHPDVANELREFFSAQDAIENVAKPLREVEPDSHVETMDHHSRSETEDLPETVRYFGDYEIEREIARGGMGIVYCARQKSLNRCVALKMIRAGLFADETEVRRFKDEAEAAGNLDHPHIVPIYEVGEHEGRHYFSMKLIEGGSLAMHLPRYRYDTKTAARVLIQVAKAIHHAHQRGILHRDLKPENVLIDSEGQPHVTDFGLAKRLESKEGLTESGGTVGTLAYMSPEQARCEKSLTTAVDVHGLGILLYVMLTGRGPFEADDMLTLLHQVVEREPMAPRAREPRVDRDLETICLKCLQKDPENRYGSAEALATDCERWLRGEPIAARRTGFLEYLFKWMRRQPAVAAICLLVPLLLLFGTVGVVVTRLWQRAETANQKLVESRHDLELALEQLGRSKKRGDTLLYAQRLGLAREKLQLEKHLDLKETLAGCSKEQRSWEWDFLRRYCIHERVLKGLSTDRFRQDVRFLADGKLISSGGGEVKVWDWQSGEVVLSFPTGEESDEGDHLAIDATGNRVVLMNALGIQVWDLQAQKKVCDIPGRPASSDIGQQFMNELKSDPELKALEERAVRKAEEILRQRQGLPPLSQDKQKPFPKVDPPPIWVVSLDLSGDGRHVLTGDTAGNLTLWDADTGKKVKVLAKIDSDEITQVLFSPDDKWVVAGSNDRKLRAWEVETGKERFTLKGHRNTISCLAVSPDGKTIVSAGEIPVLFGMVGTVEPTIKVWDVNGKKERHTIDKDVLDVQAISFSPGGERFVTSHLRGELRVWDTETGAQLGSINIPRGSGTSVQWSSDGKYLASDARGDIHIWRAPPDPRELQWTIPVSLGRRSSTYCSSSGKLLLCQLQKQEWNLKEFDLRTGGSIDKHGPGGAMWGNAPPNSKIRLSQPANVGIGAWSRFNSDGARLAVCPGDEAEVVQIWDAEAARQLFALEGHTCPVQNGFFSADGKWIATMAWEGTGDQSDGKPGEIKIWNASTGRCRQTFRSRFGTTTWLAFRPGKNQLVWSNKEQGLKLHDIVSGKRVLDLNGVTERVLCVVFSPDGRQLLVRTIAESSQESSELLPGKVVLLDLATGKRELELDCAETPYRMTFTPDGRRIVTADFQGTIRFWDAKTGVYLLSPQAFALHEIADGIVVSPASLSFTNDGKSLVMMGHSRRSLRGMMLTLR